MSFRHTVSRIFLIFASTTITVAIVLGLLYLYMTAFLPDVSALKNAELQVPLKIYTKDGNFLAEFGQLQRMPVDYDKIPPLLVDAVIATEDQRFFEHHGIDIWGLLRASGELIVTGTKSQGGSTITMQVARNFYLSREKTYGRKFNEILLAIKIDNQLSKDKIMELYLNKIYLGKRAYGVEAAARVYFGKPLSQLTLPEIAVIAGLPKAPSTINPIADPIAAKKRRDHVLDRMKELGYIDQKSYLAAIQTPLDANYHAPEVSTSAPYVAEMVRNLMETSYGADAYTQGYKVYTTIDSRYQGMANQAMRNALLAYDQRHGFRGGEQHLGPYQDSIKTAWQDTLNGLDTISGLVPAVVTHVSHDSLTLMLGDGDEIKLNAASFAWTRKKTALEVAKEGDVLRVTQNGAKAWVLAQLPQVQGAIVSLDPMNGAIRALSGGFSQNGGNFNRVTQASRQPGSSFKPFIYAAAFNKGYTLASVFNDTPLSFYNPWSHDTWEPGNDDGKFWGPMRLRFALAHSRNTISIQLLQAIGLDYAIGYLKNFGFDDSKLPHNLTLALGTAQVTPLQMATAYAVLANGGYQVSPYLIDKVIDRKNQVIYQANPRSASGDMTPAPNAAPRTISPEVAFLVTQGLQEVVRTGTGIQAFQALNRTDLAGKTGTTNDQMDGWFSGYNSDLVTTVWVGFDKPASLDEYAARAALPMWIDFMGNALNGQPLHTMSQPDGIVSAKIDPVTGHLAGLFGSGTPEFFDKDHMPSNDAEAPVSDDKTAMEVPTETDTTDGQTKEPDKLADIGATQTPAVNTEDDGHLF